VSLLAMTGLWVAVLLAGCITPALLPIAAFTFALTTSDSPLIVTFDASASQSPGGTITEYGWDFGDGSAGQGMITAHSYQTEEASTFTVTLMITDHLGQQDSVTAEVSVQVAPDEVVSVSVEFVWPFHFDASGDDAVNLNDEYFTLQNTGDEEIDLSGWSVENDYGGVFRFPSGVTLAPGAMITIYSGRGTNTATRLYWHASEPMWDNTTDLAFLRDVSGKIIHYYSYNSC